jgi:hypothetical protein
MGSVITRPQRAEQLEAEWLARAEANPGDFETIHPAKDHCQPAGHRWYGLQVRIDRPTGIVTVERTCEYCLETQEQVVECLPDFA